MSAGDARAVLADAERLLDDGDYAGSVRASAEAFALLAQADPGIVVAPFVPDDLPLTGRRMPTGRGPWPEAQGVTITLAEGEAPEIVLAKSRYTMSDAITYYEYVVDALKDADRGEGA